MRAYTVLGAFNLTCVGVHLYSCRFVARVVFQSLLKTVCLCNQHVVFQWLYEKIAVVKDSAGKSWRTLRSMPAGGSLWSMLQIAVILPEIYFGSVFSCPLLAFLSPLFTPPQSRPTNPANGFGECC